MRPKTSRPILASVVLAALAVIVLPAQADTVYLDAATIQGFTQISATGSPTTGATNNLATGAEFTTTWLAGVSGANSANVGAAALNLDWTGFDTFEIFVANNNESDWNFTVSVFDGTNTASSTLASLSPDGVRTSFTVDISALNLATIQSVYVTVGGTLPVDGRDRTAEYALTTVPLPAAAWLFGSALLGIAGIGYRRKASKA